jgi:hypothetical protein
MGRVYLNSSGLLEISEMDKYNTGNKLYQRERGGMRWSPDIPVTAVSDLMEPLWLMEIARDTHHHCLCVVSMGRSLEGDEQFERVGLCRIDVTRPYLLDTELRTIMLV